MSRRYLSNNSGSSSSSTVIQNLAIFAIAGGLGYGAVTLFNSSDGVNNDEPVQPSAPITKRVYFDINVQNQPLGRIVIGLYGSTVPKTVQNFETLCKGTKANGRQIGWVSLCHIFAHKLLYMYFCIILYIEIEYT